MADVSKIKLPNGTTYNLKDTVSGYTKNTGTITKIQTTAGVHTTINVSSGAAAFNVPTKTSHLTNDSGFITSSDLLTPLIGNTSSITPTQVNNALQVGRDIQITYTDATYGNITASYFNYSVGFNSIISNTLGYNGTQCMLMLLVGDLTSNTWSFRVSNLVDNETDPVFSTSAAAGITSNDITNWNSKVSDDKTWNGVTFNKSTAIESSDTIYIPFVTTLGATSASLTRASSTPIASYVAKYDASKYLYSTTPSVNDNSTKVATTAYVDAAIPAIPSITLNGSTTTTPSFYAPTTAGTSGYYLKSNGSGAPTWAAVTAGVSDVTVGGSSVVSSGVAVIASPVQIIRW